MAGTMALTYTDQPEQPVPQPIKSERSCPAYLTIAKQAYLLYHLFHYQTTLSRKRSGGTTKQFELENGRSQAAPCGHLMQH